MKKLKATIYEVKACDNYHSILETDNEIDGGSECHSCFNIAMFDVSGSMNTYWDYIMRHWNEQLAPYLSGSTVLYTYGEEVYFKRATPFLEKEDFIGSAYDNLTEAIAIIHSKIKACQEKVVRLFIVFDGGHNATDIQPDVEIAKLSIPPGKTIEVYIFGLGGGFPVEYSINIRSALHNGNSNVPSLFWGNREYHHDSIDSDIGEQILSMVQILKQGSVKLNLTPSGSLAPGFPKRETIHLGEFVYFPTSSKELMSDLTISTENEEISLEKTTKEMDIRFLLDRIFPQWNSVIIQYYKTNNSIPSDAFKVMEEIYGHFHKILSKELEGIDSKSIKYRLKKKQVKFLEVEFATLMNQSKIIIGIEGKYSSEFELAQHILKTTVKSKYDFKNLKMKGHSQDEFSEDMKQFINVYDKTKDKIMALPEPSPDDCCRVTMESMLKDLQDSSLHDLFKEDKFTFIKTFSVTGIPIYAPIKDSSQINPWTLCIDKILNSPFTILSHNVLEFSAEVGNFSSSENKEVCLREGDESTKFNAIIPVFANDVATVLKPLIKTNIFAMLATFCILKNAHIIDHNVHLAALGCVWIKVIKDSSIKSRPEFEIDRLNLIEATGRLYLDRSGIANYLKVLLTEPVQALMTESTEEINGKTLKCESLVKPLFLLYLSMERKEASEKLLTILPLVILEFIGRCISSHPHRNKNLFIYSHYFAPQLSTEEKRKEGLDQKLKEISDHIIESFIQEKGELLQKHYKPEDLRKQLKSYCREQLKIKEKSTLDIELNLKEVNRLKNPGSAGNINLSTLKAYAEEMKLAEETVEAMFDYKKIFVYTYHSIQHKNSKDRLMTPVLSYEEALELVRKNVTEENNKNINKMVTKKTLKTAESQWQKEYLEIHFDELAKPLTKETILQIAKLKNVNVDEKNFNKVYRYNSVSKLLRNACMIESCPFYLMPNRTFNQHISVVRRKEYPHQLHKVILETVSKGGNADDVIKHMIQVPYLSQNGLKIPAKPSTEKLKQFQKKIDFLINEYNTFGRE